MKPAFDKRNKIFIKIIMSFFGVLFKYYYRLKFEGAAPQDGQYLYIANHNSGALVESHGLLYYFLKFRPQMKHLYGFTHHSLFRIPLIAQYFFAIGGVPATASVAKEILDLGGSLLIFPGGSNMALRPLREYKKNSFLDNHGWAKIAQANNISVVPITFKNSHFINPVIFRSKTLSMILILPYLLKIKKFPITLAQIIFTASFIYFALCIQMNFFLMLLLGLYILMTSVLIPILPVKTYLQFHEPILPDPALETKVAQIMDNIY